MYGVPMALCVAMWHMKYLYQVGTQLLQVIAIVYMGYRFGIVALAYRQQWWMVAAARAGAASTRVAGSSGFFEKRRPVDFKI